MWSDVSHNGPNLSKQNGYPTSQVFYVPGEHDVFADGGKEFLNRYGKGTTGNGWQSFDYQGVHFIALLTAF
jgi:Icc protein